MTNPFSERRNEEIAIKQLVPLAQSGRAAAIDRRQVGGSNPSGYTNSSYASCVWLHTMNEALKKAVAGEVTVERGLLCRIIKSPCGLKGSQTLLSSKGRTSGFQPENLGSIPSLST